ncbi:MAG: prolyl oligopeptidase family serine peptidase [Pirellulaceae bacterium]
MFIVRRRDMDSNRPQPTLLYGYGGFDISITPRFSVTNLTWVDRGGVYAVANLRGGGEYGREWHAGGMLDRKQNVFDDFISLGRVLDFGRITDRVYLGIHGRSNGGLLVGACMCQRPDLFAAAVPGVGVMDMLRFHRFTIGHAWVSEYGSSDDPEQFQNLLSYSPIHNLHEGTRYPATLVMTADHDDRVVPAHSHKFAGSAASEPSTQWPALLDSDRDRGGHGGGKPTSMQIAEATDFLAFLSATLGLE